MLRQDWQQQPLLQINAGCSVLFLGREGGGGYFTTLSVSRSDVTKLRFASRMRLFWTVRAAGGAKSSSIFFTDGFNTHKKICCVRHIPEHIWHPFHVCLRFWCSVKRLIREADRSLQVRRLRICEALPPHSHTA
jgi:hypothetical protein